MCLAEIDGAGRSPPGVVEIDADLRQSAASFHIAFLLPEWRRKGIGSALLRLTKTPPGGNLRRAEGSR